MKIIFPIIAYFLMSVFDILGDILGKKWAIGEGASFLMMTMGLYLFSGLLFAVSLKYQELSTASIIFSAFSTLILVGAGAYLFGEKITVIKVVAIVLLLSALGLQIFESLREG